MAAIDAVGDTYEQRYNGYGEVTGRYVNNALKEYFSFNAAGQVVRTNAQDGITKAYFYDANGNKTLEIRSPTLDISLYTDTQLRALNSVDALASVTEYDAGNRVIRMYQPPIEVTANTLSNSQMQWVEMGNNALENGDISVSPVTEFALTVNGNPHAVLKKRKRLYYTPSTLTVNLPLSPSRKWRHISSFGKYRALFRAK